MALVASIASLTHTPTGIVRLGGSELRTIGVTVNLGWDSVSSRAVLDLPAIPAGARFRQQVDVELGWDGFTAPVFHGFLEDDGRDHAPLVNQMSAAGYLRLAQYQAYWAATLSGTDGSIVEDLLGLSGIESYSIDDAGLSLGNVKDLKLEKGAAPWDLVNKIDQVTGHKTFDGPTLPMRRYVSGVPAAAAAFTYVQDQNLYSCKRSATMREIHNRVEVYGLPQPSGTPGYYYAAFSPLVPIPPAYITFQFRSDLIETTAIANNVARRLIGEMNRATEDLELEMPGNPLLVPSQTISLLYPAEGISVATNYFVKHVTHRYFGSDGYTTRCIITGGIGNIGQGGVIPSPPDGGEIGDQPDGNLPGDGTGPGSGPPPGPGTGPTTGLPHAQFVARVSRETFDVAGTPTDKYTVFADGSGSVDTDSAPGSLTYAWSNNANADVGTGVFYSTSLTLAQITAGVLINLAVQDEDGNIDTIAQTLSLAASTILVRELNVAAGSRAESTPDGGKTWNTWTPGAGTVISTPEIAAAAGGYFGLSTGALYFSANFLATAPTLAHTFGGAVACVWVNEGNSNRVTVGLQTGEIWQTNDASAIASATWVLLATLADPVLWLIESGANQGQIRVASGEKILITFDNGGSFSDLITFSSGAVARRTALSFFENYGSATVGSGETDAVKSEGGTSITFPVVVPAVEDVSALTHHIREDVLYAADANGTTLRSWEKAAGASVFTAKATLASTGNPNHMIRDGGQAHTHYIAADEGLYKTFDAFGSIVMLRDYSGGGLVGYQVGYGGIGAAAVVATTIVSTPGEGTVLYIGLGAGPAGWTEPAFDDSLWDPSVAQLGNIYLTFPVIDGTAWITYESGDVLGGIHWLYRREFSLPAGAVTTCTLTIWADNDIPGVWINNVWVFADTTGSMSDAGPITVTVPPIILLTGDNVLAVEIRNQTELADQPTSLDYKLVIT